MRGACCAIALAATSTIVTAVSALPLSAAVPSGCTSIENVPPVYSGIEYGAAIQGIFDNFLNNGGMAGCADCHTSNGGTMTPAGHLDLDDGVSYQHLVGVPSYQDANVFYVVPNHPEQSLLFQKVNCDVPAAGVRMPYQGYPDGTTVLSADQQALIYDWIAEGAPVGTTDGVFRDTFDRRGFSQ
jgi:hypothetical protein